MGGILKHWRVVGSTAFAFALVIGSYISVSSIETPSRAVASDEQDVLKAIAAKDSDSDGLADWEESLYGTDPRNRDTRNLGMSDGEAVQQGLIVPKALADFANATSTKGLKYVDPDLPPAPAEGSLTGTFARNFFTRYLSAVQKSADGSLSESDLKTVANESLAELAASVVKSPDFKSRSDLKIGGSGPEALRTFAEKAQNALLANRHTATKSEIFYLKDLAEGEDVNAVPQLESLAKMYKMSAASLMAIEVPGELSQDYLDLVNSFAKLGALINDFTAVNTDPLITMLALQQYPDTVLKLGNALIKIRRTYTTAGVTFAPNEPGEAFVNIMADVAKQQSASKKP